MHKWPRGKDMARLRKQIGENLDPILNGKVLSIDPGSRSCGWVLRTAGKVTHCGEVQPNHRGEIYERLRELYDKLSEKEGIDVLVIERLRGTMSHVYLYWAVGVCVTAVRAPLMMEIPINCWHTVKPDGYVKTDMGDANLMGLAVIEIAKEIRDGQGNTNSGQSQPTQL